MAKVIKFPVPVPEKFGLQRVDKKKCKNLEKHGQLNLFMGGGKIVKLHKLSPFEDALLHDDHDDVKGARELYQKAIDENDCVEDAYCNFGILEYTEGNHSKAIDCFTLSLKNDPRHFEAHYNLANLYADLGNFSLAKLHYKVAIEVEPTFSNSYFNLGLTCAMTKDYSQAVEVLKQYKDFASDDEQKIANGLIDVITSYTA